MRSFWPTIVSLFSIIGCLQANYYGYDNYPSYYLKDYCGTGKEIRLPCDRGANARAGTLSFYNYDAIPSGTCVANITVSTGGCSSSNKYAIYFNMGTQSMSSYGKMTITEATGYGTAEEHWSVAQTLIGSSYSSSYNYYTRSVAQYRSAFSRDPAISITFTDDLISTGYHSTSVVIDYNIIHESYVPEDTYCNALSGYISKDLVCDAAGRINCPGNYHTSSVGGNPAYSSSKASEEACQLDMGSVAGIVMGILAAVTVVVAIIIVINRRRHSRLLRRQVDDTAVSTSRATANSYVNPVARSVVVAPVGYPVQLSASGDHHGPPPSYGSH